MTAFPLALLPRRCPRCCEDTITGHGRRQKQAHDEGHDWIWIRRGVCRPCGLTFTILPHWSPPYGQYSFPCREQAWEATANHDSGWEQSAPQTKDPHRMPDPATLRRWAWRRLLSLYGSLTTLGFCRPHWPIFFACAHHPCLGLAGGRPYAAVGGKLTMIWSAVDAIKQQISLLDYLQTQSWRLVMFAGQRAEGD